MNSMPLSAAELCDAMRNVRSFDATRLNRILGVDTRRGLLEAQSFTPWTAIAAALRPGDARASSVRTALPTVGESVARNAAGPDGKPAVAHVHALTLVTPDGELRRLSRTSDRELFSLAVGGHGLFGVFYSVTLRIESLLRAVEQAATPQCLLQRPGRRGARTLELLLPPEALESFIAESDARCSDWRIPLCSVELRRTCMEDDSFLRWASRDFAHLSLGFADGDALGESVRGAQLRGELIDSAMAVGGRFHIAFTREATRAQADACYPQLRTFLAHKRRFDPHERLTNAWYRYQRSLFAAEGCEVRWRN